MNFNGRALRLADTDLPRAGQLIGVGEDEIHAIVDVESSGRGFDASGRPKMLFEPHVFYRNLAGDARDRAVHVGLAYPKWGAQPYPKDSYERLIAAVAIDETAALKAASWGLTQILGENFAGAGFVTPQAMVGAFADSEGAQLDATVRLLVRMKIADALRRHDWDAVARGWNGKGYASHGYQTKLKASYERWAHVPDTPWKPTVDAAPSPLRPSAPPPPAGPPPAGPVPISTSPKPASSGLFAAAGAALIGMFRRP